MINLASSAVRRIFLGMIKPVAGCLAVLVLISPARADIVSGRAERRAAADAGAVRAIASQLTVEGASTDEADKVVRGMNAVELAYYRADLARAQPGTG